jgi:hypothetical protein
MTIDEAIAHALEMAGEQQERADSAELIDILDGLDVEDCKECAADHRQLAEWLTELKEAKGIIRVCNRVLGYLLECEIESTSTRREVETLLKSITEYLSGGSENDTR